MPIEAIAGALPAPAGVTPDAGGVSASGFGSSLDRMVKSVEQTNASANREVSRMIDGSGDVHDAMIALQRAELSLQLTLQVRNKLVSAYQEIMRMPV